MADRFRGKTRSAATSAVSGGACLDFPSAGNVVVADPSVTRALRLPDHARELTRIGAGPPSGQGHHIGDVGPAVQQDGARWDVCVPADYRKRNPNGAATSAAPPAWRSGRVPMISSTSRVSA